MIWGGKDLGGAKVEGLLVSWMHAQECCFGSASGFGSLKTYG